MISRTFLAVLLLLAATFAHAQAPRTIPYQGYLATPAGVPVSATLSMTFALYPEPEGGAAAWSETQTVPVSNGAYSVMLGAVTPLPAAFGTPYYLGVAIGADAEMTPRLPLGAVPYSLFAASAGCKPGDMMTCYEGAAGTMNVGPCKAGVRTCNEQGTGFGACVGQVVPGAELCGDAIDNNCNGAVDEGCVVPTCAVGQPMYCGIGACFRSVICTTGFDICTPGAPSAEVCNAIDDDCDGATDDQALCSLANATSVCSAGMCQLESCQTGYANVDGNPANGCEYMLNASPACSPATYQDLGSMSGDTGAASTTVNGIGEKWLRLHLTENNDGDVYLSAQIALSSPAGADYNLYVYCSACGGALAGSSTLGTGATDVVTVRWDDDWGASDDADVLIEVRYAGGASGANWTLSAYGNVTAPNSTCNP